MAERTAEVLLEHGAGKNDQVLTYAVPEALAPRLAPGARVVVPVGRRAVTGVVLAVDVPAAGFSLRPIALILEGEALVTPVQARLADWLAARYLCRLCDAWRLFLPPGVARRGMRRIGLAVPWRELRCRLEKFILPAADAERLRNVLAALVKADASPDRLKDRLGPVYKQVEVLLGEGYLAWREPWQQKTPGARHVTFVRLAEHSPARPTPKQAKVLAFLATRADRSASREEVLAACGVGANVLARMRAGGYLILEERLERRTPSERNLRAAEAPPCLYPAQEKALAWVREHMESGGCMLLHGVTGSGKTEVYLRALALAVDRGRTGILLVPEIGLTPQTVERVVARFGERVAVLHSRLSVGERRDEWERIRAGEAAVVVGPRSALFAPLDKIGLVILDEEHDQAYKQEDGLRYHAREVAAELCRLSRAVLILGSATPSLEAMVACERGEAAYYSLPARPGGRSLPTVELVDLRLELKAKRTSIMSQRLREALADCLASGNQAILLLNRRGYATFVICRECGFALRCPHCDVSLTYHQGLSVLLCHYCGYGERVPDICPNCRGRYIRYFGLGTERLCEEVAQLFPAARVARMDQDSTARKRAHLEIYHALRQGEIDILVGTQMVAKGLDLPRVTLVGVVAADASLNRPDFRAAERTFQLLTQVAGRAGRGDTPGRVILQTYNPGHYSLVCAANHDYELFYRQECLARSAAGYPPYTEMVRIGLTGRDERATWRAANELAAGIKDAVGAWDGDPGVKRGVEVMGPTAALVRRVEDRYRVHLLLKTDRLAPIGPILVREVARLRETGRHPGIAVAVDVNPNTVL
ncbi:MAG: primosomal protein N' [Bacteroidota bacterium]